MDNLTAGKKQRSRWRALVAALHLALGVSLGVPPRSATASETVRSDPPATAAKAATTGHLQSAVHWAKAKRYPFVLEHLSRIDPTALDHASAAAYAQLLGHVASRRPRLHRLKALIAQCHRAPLRQIPICAEARARWLIARGRISDALAIWQERYTQFAEDPAERRKLMLIALFFLGRSSANSYQWDLAVQQGAVWRFVEQIPHDDALRDDPEIALAIAKVALRIAPESEKTEATLARAVEAHGADPRALSVRGDLDAARGQWDRALPWYVWAAYTSSAHRDEDYANHWTKLSQAYHAIGWIQHAVEAADHAAIPRSQSFPSAEAGESSGLSSCRAWHDWLIAYEPETLVRAHGVGWEATIEDLGVWYEECSREPDVPYCADPQARGPRVPIQAVRYLRDQWQERGHRDRLKAVIGERLLCVVQQSTLLTEAVVEAVNGNWSMSLASFERQHARALVQARSGQLADALNTWSRSFPTGFHRVDPENPPLPTDTPSAESERLETILGSLASAHPAQLANARDDVHRFIDRWRARIQVDSQAGTLALLRARLERRIDPRSSRARQAVEDAIILSAGQAQALAMRGLQTLESDRPEHALPWLIWAHDHGRFSPEVHNALISVYTALGWWEEADALMRAGTSEPATKLEPQHTLPNTLPSGCRRLAEKLLKLELRNAIVRHGQGWEHAIRPYRDWQAACVPSPVRASG